MQADAGIHRSVCKQPTSTKRGGAYLWKLNLIGRSNPEWVDLFPTLHLD